MYNSLIFVVNILPFCIVKGKCVLFYSKTRTYNPITNASLHRYLQARQGRLKCTEKLPENKQICDLPYLIRQSIEVYDLISY